MTFFVRERYLVNSLIDLAIEAACTAGEAILKYRYKSNLVTYKQDNSPLTLADQHANSLINEYLARSNILVVSEESEDLHLDASCYWLVDPLDGTKDFLVGNDEFTVNISLINDRKPVLGVVFAPAIDNLCWGARGIGAWCKSDKKIMALKSRPSVNVLRMATSHFHNHLDIKLFAKENNVISRVAIGSAFKFSLLAMSEVDVYPRLVGSSEWDTAAGQALLESVGGQVLNWHTGQPLQYGKANRRNPKLFSIRSPYGWEDFKLKTYETELL